MKRDRKLSAASVSFIRRAEELKVRIARDRDALRALLEEYEAVAESADRAVDHMGEAIDALSEYV